MQRVYSVNRGPTEISSEQGDKNDLLKEMQTMMKVITEINPYSMVAKLLGSDDESEERTESSKLFDISNASKEMKEIRLNETQHLIYNTSILHIDEEILQDDYLVMDVKGSGILDVQIINEEKQKTLLKYGKVTNSKASHQKRVVFSTFFLRKFKGGYLKLDLDSVFLGE